MDPAQLKQRRGRVLVPLFCYSRNYGQRVAIGDETVVLFEAIAAATELHCDGILREGTSDRLVSAIVINQRRSARTQPHGFHYAENHIVRGDRFGLDAATIESDHGRGKHR